MANNRILIGIMNDATLVIDMDNDDNPIHPMDVAEVRSVAISKKAASKLKTLADTQQKILQKNRMQYSLLFAALCVVIGIVTVLTHSV